MRIELTQRHIDLGERCSCYECPIARGIKEILGDDYEVEVGCSTVTIWHDGAYTRFYELAPNAQAFIKVFDSGGAPAPISFDLLIEDLLCPSATL